MKLMKHRIFIKWQRLLDEKGETCDRCNKTYQNLEEALSIMKPLLDKLDIDLIFEKVAISLDDFKKNPLSSNQILIDGAPIEEILSLKIGQSSCCGPCGDSECRTIIEDDKEVEEVPVKTILKSILKRVNRIVEAS